MHEEPSAINAIVRALTTDPGITLGAILGSLGILAGVLISITSIVSQAWRRVREAEDLNALKHEMLERGMSTAEIAQVVEASPRRHSWARHCDGGKKGR